MVGLTAAIIGSAVIGAGASAIGASKNSKAIRKSQQAQTAANDQSIALQRETYGQNKEILNPFVQRGNRAGDAYNALLGLGGGFTGGADRAQIIAQPMPNGYQGGQGFGDGNIERGMMGEGTFSAMQYGQPTARPEMGQMQNTPQNGVSAADAAKAAFDQFRGSTGYQFRMDEGTNALNSAYAGAGTLRSGAAANAFQKYGQDYASNEFGNYMGYLGNQQGVGLQAGSALAGVGQNFANNVSNLNSQQANNISNAAVARANNTNSMIGGITSSFGNALGAYGQMGGFGAKAPTAAAGGGFGSSTGFYLPGMGR